MAPMRLDLDKIAHLQRTLMRLILELEPCGALDNHDPLRALLVIPFALRGDVSGRHDARELEAACLEQDRELLFRQNVGQIRKYV